MQKKSNNMMKKINQKKSTNNMMKNRPWDLIKKQAKQWLNNRKSNKKQVIEEITNNLKINMPKTQHRK